MRDTSVTVTSKSLPRPAAHAAFFIDFDGTLVPIAERPDMVKVPPTLLMLLENLAFRAGGALAVVTGRSLQAVDRFLSPLKLPVAAEHGFARRDADGTLHLVEDSGAAAAVAAKLGPFAAANPGIVLEQKVHSVALHYRQRPELAEASRKAVEEALREFPELHLLSGKMVYEIRPKGVTKGTALLAFLDEAPFKGRVPIVAGDDTTDEDAFAAANERGGISIKIGEGATLAQYRSDRESFIAWLEEIAADN